MKKNPSLLVCILLDLLGYASYALPILGEFGDIIWAPISALIFYKLFGGWKGAIGGVLNFVEELFPGLDFIPSFTIMWFLKLYSNKTEIKQSIQPV
ncbi:MAG: hypothetical protein IT249_20055 [Chitinophagaceae bacterium]|nr:hypothetical protein [Chitinophagaceae bacterium]